MIKAELYARSADTPKVCFALPFGGEYKLHAKPPAYRKVVWLEYNFGFFLYICLIALLRE